MDKEQIGCCYFVDSSGLRCFCTLRRPSLPQPCNFPPPPATTPPATTVINLHKAAFQIRNKAAYINIYEFRTRDMPLPSLSTSCVLPPPLHTPHLTLIRHKLCLLPPYLPPTLPYTSCASYPVSPGINEPGIQNVSVALAASRMSEHTSSSSSYPSLHPT